MTANSATQPTATVLLGCSKCGASLPDEAQFCLKCGKPVSAPAKSPAIRDSAVHLSASKPPRKWRGFLWALLAILFAVILWAATSDSTGAQQLQGFVGLKQDRSILDSSFSVGAHTFRYYKFSLPEGSVNVAVVGQFNSTADSEAAGNRKAQTGKSNKSKDTDVDNSIEVYVLTDSAFTVWQNGYGTSSLYASGKVEEGKSAGRRSRGRRNLLSRLQQ